MSTSKLNPQIGDTKETPTTNPNPKKVPFKRMAYTADFKENAVAMATAEGASIPKVAEELGISDQTLRNWIKQKTTGTPLAPTNGKVDDESMKLLALEAENRRLKKEVLLLKKWQAYLTNGKV